VTGKYFYEAEPSWPEEQAAPAGAPNVVIVVLDDVGYAQLGCFGSDIETPTMDGLAAAGLQYTNFHTTALCSATRSSLLTGRNHHRNGMGRVVELATGFPGYNAIVPAANGFLSEALLEAGYATMAVGKWHLTPESELHAAATRRRWPLGRGFERFYGFMSGENHQFAPTLYCDNHVVRTLEPHAPDYHLTEDLVAQATRFVRDVRSLDPRKPFFLYFAPGACHSPHQAPRRFVEHYRGRFDRGWDDWRSAAFERQRDAGLLPPTTELSPRPPWVPSWDSLDERQHRLYARYMEAFAAYLSHTDSCLGELVATLDAVEARDDTLVVLFSDNGASSEGGPTGSLNDLALWNRIAHSELDDALDRLDEIGGPTIHNNYPWGWTVAGNTPFRRWKREVHEGGVADPLIVRWPSRIREPGLRAQYVHVVDVMPTVLACAGVRAPDELRGVVQTPLDGIDFSETFDDPGRESARRLQYYEMFGSRALYRSGWKAVTHHAFDRAELRFTDDAWELYHVAIDPSECHDLAAEEPERLREMVEDWWIEAARNGVLPLDNRPFSDWVRRRPNALPRRDRYVYYPGISQIPEVSAVNLRRRRHRVVAELSVERGTRAAGTLIAQGSFLGGWGFYLLDGELLYVHNLLGRTESTVRAPVELAAGRHEAWFTCVPEGERATVAIGLDGGQLAVGTVPLFTPVRFSLTGAGLTCGYGNALPVGREIPGPFPFDHGLERVVVEVEGAEHVDADGEARAAIVTQ
jgi:arylsulfatase